MTAKWEDSIDRMRRSARRRAAVAVAWLALAPAAGTASAPGVEANGTPCFLLPEKSAVLKAEVSRRLAEVAVEPGRIVRKGQLLVRFVDDGERILLERATVVLARAEQNLDRLRRLHEEEGLSLDALQEAEAAAGIARAERDLARFRLEELSIRAPFDGVVVERFVSPGASVEEGETLCRVVGLTPLVVEARIPERHLAALRGGGRVRLRVTSPDTLFTVALPGLAPVVDPVSNTFLVRLLVDNAAGRFVPGVRCRVEIPEANGGARAEAAPIQTP